MFKNNLMTYLFGALLVSTVSGAFAVEFYREPYLQQSTHESVVIVFRTREPINPIVRYGAKLDDLDDETSESDVTLKVSVDVDAADDVARLFSPDPNESYRGRGKKDAVGNTYQYEILIDDLDDATKYFYAIHNEDALLVAGEDYYFQTHPDPGDEAPLRFWVVGDSGTGGSDQRKVHEAMIEYTQAENHPPDLYIHVGDMAYGDGTDLEFQYKFFGIYADTLRHLACYAAMGNHEGHTSRGISGIGPYYDAYVLPTQGEAGGVASGTEAYYSFDYGNVHFICLDSHDLDRSPTAAMAEWLRADLEETDADWLIAYWHHPPYTKGSHDSDDEIQLIEMRENIMPILESGGVDLTFTGHSHIYERSMLMDGAYATPTVASGVILDDGDGDPSGDGAYRKSEGLNPNEGSISIVCGNGGTGIRRSGTMPVMKKIIVEHGSVIIDIEDDTLTGIMVNKDRKRRDLFSIVKDGEVSVTRIAEPWQHEKLPGEE